MAQDVSIEKELKPCLKKQLCTENVISHRHFRSFFSKQFKSLMTFVPYMHIFWQNLEGE